MDVQPLAPVYTADLFAPLHGELLSLLRELTEQDWQRPTAAGAWRVRDVAAHLLDGDLRVLSLLRDGHGAPPPAGPVDRWADLVAYLDQLNAQWVTASHRLSPRVLVELLAATGHEAAATFAAQPPHAPAPFPVAWAGEDAAMSWMHVGREYTERWHHQMQIRDAVGAPGLLQRRWLAPLLDLSLRALPRAYAGVTAAAGAGVVVEVDGAGGGAWSLVRGGVAGADAGGDPGWRLFAGRASAPRTVVGLDADTAWRTLYHALDPATARRRARVEGDEALAEPLFRARAVMV